MRYGLLWVLVGFLRLCGLIRWHVECDEPGCPVAEPGTGQQLPPGWTAVDGRHYCPDHRLRLVRKKKAEW
jgi:hypothetical protein